MELCILQHTSPVPLLLLVNPLGSKGNYSAASNNTKLVHWQLMGGLLHLVQRGWSWVGWAPPSPLLAVPNFTANPSTASVPVTVLLYDSQKVKGQGDYSAHKSSIISR